MKLPLLKYAVCFLFMSLLLSGCQSTKPAYLSSENTGSYHVQKLPSASGKSLETQSLSAEAEPKTVGFPAEKVLYAAPATQPEAFLASTNAQELTPFPAGPSAKVQLPEKAEKTVSGNTYDEPEKVRGRTLSGIFLAAGTLVLLVALGLVIAGTSGAGIVAWIGGGLFLTGFIFSMVALLGR
jgi:hypothetical protein